MRRTILVLVATLTVIVSVGGGIVARAAATEDVYRGGGISPTNIGALRSEQTRLAGIPTELREMIPELRPDVGTVHVLGRGAAFAWEKPGRICLWEALVDGCLGQVSRPLNIVVGDPDLVGSGRPARVYGIATDEVASVTVKLDDGRSVTADATENFYDVDLPDDVAPWAPLTVVAQLRDGTAYSQRV
jgi:hypothetical protein